jgi:site-specific DNA-adenine methylase
MRYLGGKFRTCKKILELISGECPPEKYDTFIEPFCGALNIGCEAVSYYDNVICSDYCEDVVLLWNHVKEGKFTEPIYISKEEHTLLKNDKPSWKRAIAGSGFSFRALWFGAYDSGKYVGVRQSNPVREVFTSIKRKEPKIKKIKEITHKSYKDIDVSKGNNIIYCDPPYGRTMHQYGTATQFNSEEFWKVVKEWAKTNHVYVSEKECPIEHEVIYEWSLSISPSNTKIQFTDKLFYIV